MSLSKKLPTGFQSLDDNLGGGLEEAPYLFASAAKAGKSSFVRKLAFQMAMLGTEVAFIDTEVPERKAFESFVAIMKEKPISEVTEEDYAEAKEVLGENMIFRDSRFVIQELYTKGGLDIEKVLKELKHLKSLGSKMFIFDNVTRCGMGQDFRKRQELMQKLMDFATGEGVLGIQVAHTYPQRSDTTTRQDVLNAAASGQYDELLEKNIEYMALPTTAEIYGGAITTQYYGTFMIWRPCKDWESERHNKVSWLLAREMKSVNSFKIRFEYIGSQTNFKEYREPFWNVDGDKMLKEVK